VHGWANEGREDKTSTEKRIATPSCVLLIAFLLASFSYKYSNDSRQNDTTIADVYVQSVIDGTTHLLKRQQLMPGAR
jgi:hypothetical protein